MILSNNFYKITPTSNYTEFYDYIKTIVLDRDKKEAYFEVILNIH